MELLRRMVLAFGVCGFVWAALDSPPALFRVCPVDFAARYARRLERQRSPLGTVSLADALTSKLDAPPSLEDYVARETEHRVISVKGEVWAGFYQTLSAAVRGSGSPQWTSRVRGGYATFKLDEPPLDLLVAPINELRASAGWATVYLTIPDASGIKYLEVEYNDRPKQAAAPTSFVYPSRRWSGWLLLGGLLAYLLPGGRKPPNAVGYDRLGAVLPLDVLGTVLLAGGAALPLWFAHSTAEALGEGLSSSIFFWSVGLAGLGLLVWAARHAAFRIEVSPDGLVHRGLFGRDTYGFDQITRVERLEVRGLPAGIVLRMTSGRTVRLEWRDLERFELVLEALKRVNLLPPAGHR